MTDKITLEQLQVRCRFIIRTILKCRIHAKYGEHTSAEVIAVVKGEEVKAILTDITEEKITVFSVSANGDGDTVEEILFAGIINGVELVEEGEYATLFLKAVSSAWKMDVKKKSRSFQDVSMTYRDVAESVIRTYGADLVWNGPNKHLKHPLIQYKETDYQFIQRILSHVSNGVTIGDSSVKICLYAGIREGNNKGNIDLEQYRYSVLPFQNRIRDKLQNGYKIEDMDFAKVGDIVQIQGRNFYVMESNINFEQNIMKCDCLVFPKQCFEVEKIPSKTLSGAILTGRILETGRELVKMHLDIDKEQLPSGAYEFLWKPIMGNLLYCMPEVGTKAALYLGNSEEDSAIVIYSIRENGDVCEEFADYNNRYFTTANGKRMYLKPSEMGLHNMINQNAEITLKDGSTLNVKTSQQVSVMAEGQVELKGRNVTITTPKEATLVKKDLISPTVINMCNAFDAIGKAGNFAAAPQVVEKQRKKTVPSSGQIVEKYPLDGMVEMVLSNIPVEDTESPVMEIIAESMPIVTGMRTVKSYVGGKKS